jgi:hypothetical protein
MLLNHGIIIVHGSVQPVLKIILYINFVSAESRWRIKNVCLKLLINSNIWSEKLLAVKRNVKKCDENCILKLIGL